MIVPNAKLLADNIINYSANETRRVDLTVGVSYDADLAGLKRILSDIAGGEARVVQDPPVKVAVDKLADKSVNPVMRMQMWTRTSGYGNVRIAAKKAIELRLDEAGIGIPYSQRDVHFYQHKVA